MCQVYIYIKKIYCCFGLEKPGCYTAHVDSETIKENLVAGLSEIVTENVSRVDAWIHQRTLHLFTQKESRKTESLPTHKSSLKMFPELMHGFISAHYPFDTEGVKENGVAAHSEIAPESAFKGDAWISQRTQPLLTQKQSRKTK